MDLQEIVRRLRMNQSIKAIKRETGRHRSVIRRVRELAEQEGWLQAAELPGERQLRERYHEQQQAERGAAHPLDAHREKIAGWLKLKEPYSFLVIHKLLTGRGWSTPSTVRRYRGRRDWRACRVALERVRRADAPDTRRREPLPENTDRPPRAGQAPGPDPRAPQGTRPASGGAEVLSYATDRRPPIVIADFYHGLIVAASLPHHVQYLS